MTKQSAIEELKCYRAKSGTEYPEEIEIAVAALEKQIPKKPITHEGTNRVDCPICGATVRGIKEPFGDWCSKCGQRLDWE